MTTLITCGAGFLGSYYLTRLLIKEGDHPILLDTMPIPEILSNSCGKFEYVSSSQGNLSTLHNVIRKYSIDIIFHLRGMLSTPSNENPWAAFDTNVIGTYNVLEAARLEGVQQVIFSSIIAVYGKDLPNAPVNDATL